MILTLGTSAWAKRPTATPSPSPTPATLPQTITISSPVNGATITANTVVVDDDSLSQCGGKSWYDVLYVDGKDTADCSFSTCVFSPAAFSAGTHAIQIHAHTANAPAGYECATSQTVSVSIGSASNVGNEIAITAPVNGQAVSGSAVPVSVTLGPDVYSDQLVVDGTVVATGSSNFIWNSTKVANGQHILAVNVFQQGGSSPIGSASVTVSVNNTSGTPAPTPSPTSTPASTPTPAPTASPTPAAGAVTMLPAIAPGAPLAGVTGSPSAIISSIYNALSYPGQAYGNYSDPNGTMGTGGTVAACCGPLLDDRQAASVVMATPETNVATSGGTADNSYYQNVVLASTSNQSSYLTQLNAVNTGWGTGPMATVMTRVDGTCPIQNPTTAEIVQWAANKWGFNPKYGYAEACDEGDWNNTSLGDSGTSSGVFQVADRGVNHGWGPLVSANSDLARESTCYNADFFFATRWASFHSATAGASLGISGETPPYNMADTVESWYLGSVSNCPGGSNCAYQQMIYSDIISGWQNAGYTNNGINPPCWYVGSHYFNGAIPTGAPAGSAPHE